MGAREAWWAVSGSRRRLNRLRCPRTAPRGSDAGGSHPLERHPKPQSALPLTRCSNPLSRMYPSLAVIRLPSPHLTSPAPPCASVRTPARERRHSGLYVRIGGPKEGASSVNLILRHHSAVKQRPFTMNLTVYGRNEVSSLWFLRSLHFPL